MTPQARIAAACDILDLWLDGVPGEKALTTWARQHRFAGSKDRAAIRDHVFDAIRQRRSAAALGGSDTGRGLMIGLLRAAGQDPAQMFTGVAYAPAALSPAEEQAPRALTLTEELDCPDWLAPALQTALGTDFTPVMQRLRHRAALFLRVNLRKTTPDKALQLLHDQGVAAAVHPLSPTALIVTDGARRVQQTDAYQGGLVEVQDAASQAICDTVAVPEGGKVLDYCAGGGGKTLSLAARADARFFVHDAALARMVDLPDRAARAGISATVLDTRAVASQAPFDLVLADVPCSGSGAWSRQAEAKWNLTPQALENLCKTQEEILDICAGFCAAQGRLVYMTCSILPQENSDQVQAFLVRNPGWHCELTRQFTPIHGADGLFAAHLSR